MIRKRSADPAADPGDHWPDEKWAKGLPILCEYLSHSAYEDGSPRERSKLSIFSQDGLVGVALNDPEEHASLYRTGESVEKALQALEKALGASQADWRRWNVGKSRKKA